MGSDLTPDGFTHLHVHSHYTLLGGTAAVADLVARAAAQGLARLALTDTNTLYGAVAFSRACQAAGILPILGMVATVAPAGDLAALGAPGSDQVVLLSMDPAGYRSLCRISSLIQGQPQRETLARQGLPWDVLATHSDGLLCLAGGRRSHLEHFLRRGDDQTARRLAARSAAIFGDRAYLALEIHQAADVALAQQVQQLGHHLGLPAVAVQPVYGLAPADGARLRLLAAIDQNCRLDQVPASALPDQGDPGVTLHWLPSTEVARRFAALPGAVAAAAEVAGRCGPALPDGRPIWPALQLPAGATPDAALAEEAAAGLQARFGDAPQPVVHQRLQAELAAIAAHGYSPLFLVVAGIVRFARNHDIPVSTRGSVANSLVAYCTGITTVDPIAHDLLFERFLNPARANPPDIDLDFCSRRRDEVLEHVRQVYDGAGEPQVALVSTVSTMRPKSAVREVAKAYGLDEASTEALIKLLPGGWHPDPRRRSRKTVEDVATEVDDLRLRQVLLDAAPLVGQPHHLSVHPGGLVITPGPLTDIVPVQWTAKGFLITQFDAEGVEAIGLPKLDLLGIRALTVLADTAQLVRRHYDAGFHLDRIPLDDTLTGDMLACGDTIGVFQCESAGAQRTLRQLQARTVQDLAVANAFFKPGPAMGGMARSFVRRYRGQEEVTFLHPALKPILGKTKGVLIFQEQILRLAREVAGLTWEQADHLRRGMSHFGRAEMEALQAVFVAGCLRRPPAGPGLNEQQARALWDQVLPFAGYGFNQGHATAYADVSYRSAYLKAHWPAAFLAARLGGWGGFHHPAIYMAEAVRLGIAVRPPHINHSGRKFTLQPGSSRSESREQAPVDPAPSTLWMGLGQVRDMRRASVQAILGQRRRAPFMSLRDLLNRVPLQPKETAHLIQCGALDGLGDSRAGLLAVAKEIIRAGSTGQTAFDFAGEAVPPEPAAQRLAWEQFVLGQPVSVHPLDLVRDSLPATAPLRALPAEPQRPLVVAAVRLPGWTGGRGVFIGDGDAFVVAAGPEDVKAPPSWQPHLLRGRWLTDEWGTGWFQVDAWQPLA